MLTEVQHEIALGDCLVLSHFSVVDSRLHAWPMCLSKHASSYPHPCRLIEPQILVSGYRVEEKITCPYFNLNAGLPTPLPCNLRWKLVETIRRKSTKR
jgi:hypothetical protein